MNPVHKIWGELCSLAKISTPTAVGILIRSTEKGLLEGPDAIGKLAPLAKCGRYKHSIIEDARLNLEG
jgi:hypothetical protein